MGQPGHRGGQGKGLAGQGRVLGQHFLLPGLAQRRGAGGGRVGEDLVGREPLEALADGGQVHGLAPVGGDADRGVQAVGLLSGLGGLGHDALGEVDPASEIRKQPRHHGAFEGPVQLHGQFIHGYGIIGKPTRLVNFARR